MLCLQSVHSSKNEQCCGKVAKVLVEKKYWPSKYMIYHFYKDAAEDSFQTKKRSRKRIGITDDPLGRKREDVGIAKGTSSLGVSLWLTLGQSSLRESVCKVL